MTEFLFFLNPNLSTCKNNSNIFTIFNKISFCSFFITTNISLAVSKDRWIKMKICYFYLTEILNEIHMKDIVRYP